MTVMSALSQSVLTRLETLAQNKNQTPDDFVQQLLDEYTAVPKSKPIHDSFFEEVIEILETGVIVSDEKGDFIYVCPNISDQWGYSASEIQSMGNIQNLPFINITLPKLTDVHWREEHRIANKKGETISLNINITLMDGNKFLYEIRNVTTQQALLAEVQSYEQQISTIINHLPVILFALNRDGVYTLSEGHDLEAIGLKPGQAVGKSAFELFPEVRTQLKETYARVLTGEVVKSHVEVRGKVFDVAYSPHKDQQGQIIGILGIAFDDTERHQMQQALATSEKRAVKAERIAAIGHWDWDIASGDLFWSEGIFHLFGLDYPPAEKISFALFMEFVHPNDRDMLLQAIEAATRNQAVYDIEHRIILRDGTYKYVHENGEVMFDENGQAVRMIGTAQDVTQRVQALNTALASKQRLRAQYESIPVPTSTWQKRGDDFVLIDVNQATKSVSPEIETLFGKTAREVYPQGHDIIQDLETCFIQKGLFKHEIPYKTLTGSQDQRHIIFTYAYSSPDIITVHAEDITQRKKAELVLREAHDHLERQVKLRTQQLSETNLALKTERDFANTLIDIAPVIVLVLDTQGRIVRYNRYLENLTGISLAEVQSHEWIPTFLPERYKSAIHQLFAKAIKGESTIGNVNPIIGKNGEERQILWYDKALRDSANQITGILAIGLDVTDRMNAEIALIRSEQLYRTLLELSPVGIFHTNKDGVAIFVNDRLVEIFGMSFPELHDYGWLQSVHPDDRRKVKNEWQRTFETQQDFSLEYRLRSGWVYGVAKPIFDENGQINGYIGAVMDIHELRQAQEELLIKDLALQSASNAISIANLDGQLIYVNPAFVGMWRYDTVDEIIGRPFSDFSLSQEYAQEIFQELIEKGRWLGEAIARTKDGTQFDIYIESSIIFDRNNQPIAFIGSSIDITQRKLQEKAEQEQHLLQLSLRLTAERLSASLEIDDIIDNILTSGKMIVDHDYGCLLLLDDNATKWHITTSQPKLDLADLKKIDLTTLLIFNDLLDDSVAVINHLKQDHPDLELPPCLHANLAIGLDSGVERLGVLILWSHQAAAFNQQDVENLRIFAEQATRAIINNKLYTASQEIARLRERNEIAHNLHDSVSQTLWSANIIANTLPTIWATDPAKCFSLIKDLANIIQFALAEMRALLMELKPQSIMQGGLLEMITHLISTVSKTHIKFNFDVTHFPELSVQEQLVIYRITQEALNNIVKHAQASEVTISSVYQADKFIYQIRDDGQGFDISDVSTMNMGLSMMKERAQQINAELAWLSQSGSGTEVILTLNLENESE